METSPVTGLPIDQLRRVFTVTYQCTGAAVVGANAEALGTRGMSVEV